MTPLRKYYDTLTDNLTNAPPSLVQKCVVSLLRGPTFFPWHRYISVHRTPARLRRQSGYRPCITARRGKRGLRVSRDWCKKKLTQSGKVKIIDWRNQEWGKEPLGSWRGDVTTAFRGENKWPAGSSTSRGDQLHGAGGGSEGSGWDKKKSNNLIED